MLKFIGTHIKKSKIGSSLSETMIVLVMLGIISTIFLGTIIADSNKKQTVVRLQKLYSVLTQSINLSSTDNGTSDTWDLSDNLSSKGSYYVFEKYFKPYLVLARDCKNSTESDCNYEFKELNGTEKSLNSTWARFFLNDGAFLALQAISKDTYKVIYFYVDVNGKKRLNVVARDIFIFEYWIQNDEHPEYTGKLLPFGHQYSRSELISESEDNNCNKSKNGNYCSSLIMKDGWQIIQGYPWAQARYVVK